MTDLAGIVARDAEFVEQPDGTLAYSWVNARSGERKIAPHATDPDGPADRRALLVLLRETRDALATLYHNVTDGNGVRYHAAVPVLHASRKTLDRLAALDVTP